MLQLDYGCSEAGSDYWTLGQEEPRADELRDILSTVLAQRAFLTRVGES